MAKKSYDMLVSFAKAQVGYKEKATNAELDSPTANAGNKNWNKFAAFIDETYHDFYNGKKNGYDWCDIFVDYCFLKVFGLEQAMRLLCQPKKSSGAGCTSSRSYYRASGKYDKTPTIGSQIFFTKDGGKTCYHTGIVCAIEADMVLTVEGNSGDEVRQHIYARSDKRIDGYGHPDYDSVEEVKPMLSTVAVAQEVIAGKWGTGEERKTKLTDAGYNPSEVQSIVNAILKGEKVEDAPSSVETYTINIDRNKYKQVIINFV